MKHDIVYLLKNDCDSEELKYSIRSVVQNFPYRKLVIVGGCPSDIKPDIYIPDTQEGATKWERAMHSLKKVLDNDELTEDIWLFNDDFFIMDPVRSDVNYFSGSLERQIIKMKQKHPRGSGYIRSLETLRACLFNLNKDTLCFALHIPFLINRVKAEKLFEEYPGIKMFRTFYGNWYEIECSYMRDVKVYDLETIPDTPYISTTDESFKKGKVGEFLRKYFANPSKYEKNTLLDTVREIYTEEGDIRYEN